jgi:transcriptional regulator with XRE-family HTH domain
VEERRALFGITLDRFAGRQGLPEWITSVSQRLRRDGSKTVKLLEAIREQVKRNESQTTVTRGVIPLEELSSNERAAIMGQILDRLKNDGRFDPWGCLNMTWDALESSYFGMMA